MAKTYPARHFVHAAGRGELGYTDRMKALRSALIHFARSGHWSEAVDLLESESALKSTITASFNLYIRVSALASSDQEQANRALLDHIRSEATIEDQDEDGETILRKVDQYSVISWNGCITTLSMTSEACHWSPSVVECSLLRSGWRTNVIEGISVGHSIVNST